MVAALDDTKCDTLGRLLLTSDRFVVVLCLHNAANKKKHVPSAGFEPAIPTIEWPQTYVLDSPATGISSSKSIRRIRDFFSNPGIAARTANRKLGSFSSPKIWIS